MSHRKVEEGGKVGGEGKRSARKGANKEGGEGFCFSMFPKR